MNEKENTIYIMINYIYNFMFIFNVYNFFKIMNFFTKLQSFKFNYYF